MVNVGKYTRHGSYGLCSSQQPLSKKQTISLPSRNYGLYYIFIQRKKLVPHDLYPNFTPLIESSKRIFYNNLPPSNQYLTLDIQIPCEDRCLNPHSHLLRLGFQGFQTPILTKYYDRRILDVWGIQGRWESWKDSH